MSKHHKHSRFITLLDDLPSARDSYQDPESLTVLYTQLENLARDRSDQFNAKGKKETEKQTCRKQKCQPEEKGRNQGS